MFLGIEEVGRGAWAGPMVVGAVVLGDVQIEGLNDSKKLTAKKREQLTVEIKKSARGIGVGWVSSTTIDKIGLSAALKLAARRAVAQIDCDYDQIIIDGTIRLIDDPRVSVLPRADGLISAVSAASIIAKVARDNYMAQLDRVFSGYGFTAHVGYGTAAHRKAIVKNGVLPIHRQSFAPVAEIASAGRTTRGRSSRPSSRGSSLTPSPSFVSPPSSGPTDAHNIVGHIAENVAAEYLVRQGHEIIEQNWKTKYCEVDIISMKDETVYFTEVKYRKIDRWGDGLDAITQKKENQMRFAAKFWLEKCAPRQKPNAKISVIALADDPPTVKKYIESI
jgi:ribonuclease HII